MPAQPPAPTRLARTLHTAALAGMLAVTGWVAWQAVPTIRADWLTSQARNDIERWTSGKRPWTTAQWDQAHRDFAAAAQLTPDDAVLHEALAMLYMLRGSRNWGDGGEASPGVADYRLALGHQLKAIELRPLFPTPWANLALIHYALGSPEAEVFGAFRRALELGRNETEVKILLLNVARQAWVHAPDDVRAWAETVEPGISQRLDAEADAQPDGVVGQPTP